MHIVNKAERPVLISEMWTSNDRAGSKFSISYDPLPIAERVASHTPTPSLTKRRAQHLPLVLQPIQIIAPPLRHFDTFIPESPASISRSNRIPILVCQGPFDGVWMPLPALIQESGRHGTETVRRHLIAGITQPSQARIHGIF